MDQLEENKLVAEAQRDSQAFGVIFDMYYPKILQYATRRIGNLELAQDITADVFYKALHKLWQFKWRAVPFSAWLYRIANNEINQHFRKGTYRKVTSLENLMEGTDFEPQALEDLQKEREEAEREIERHAEYKIVQEAVRTLPLHYQEVISLRYFEKKKLTEIAVILGKKEGTIKSLHSRALVLLRKVLEAHTQDATFSTQRIIRSEG
jgi:RNA polymerase sigma-70 factor, ECF subfamily